MQHGGNELVVKLGHERGLLPKLQFIHCFERVEARFGGAGCEGAPLDAQLRKRNIDRSKRSYIKKDIKSKAEQFNRRF